MATAEYHRDYYLRTRDRRNELKRQSRKERGKRYQEVLDEIKSVPCMDCGGTFPPYVMDFDHRDPGDKDGTIGRKTRQWSLERLLAEAEKCDVVCSNCHRIRTYGV